MIHLENWAAQAFKKLDEEKKGVKGQKETVMSGAVLSAVKDFCVQDEEFAQAVVQGGTFGECMNTVAKGVGSSISDLDAYKKAVQFYFPGAEIKMAMTIDLIGKAAGDTEPVAEQPAQVTQATKVISLDLADFFG